MSFFFLVEGTLSHRGLEGLSAHRRGEGGNKWDAAEDVLEGLCIGSGRLVFLAEARQWRPKDRAAERFVTASVSVSVFVLVFVLVFLVVLGRCVRSELRRVDCVEVEMGRGGWRFGLSTKFMGEGVNKGRWRTTRTGE
jgi:hypothetical protein